MRLVEEPAAFRWHIVNRNLTPGFTVMEKISQKMSGLAKLLVHFPPDSVHLQVVLERLSKKGLFDARLTLRLPSNILHARKTGTDLLVTINTAMQALKREVMGLKAELRGDHRWKRPARRAELNAVKRAALASPLQADSVVAPDPELAAELFADHHASLLSHAGRTVRMAELTGDLPLRALEPGDIVDEVARIVLDPRGQKRKPSSISYQQWFFRLMQEEMDRQVRRFAEEMHLRAEPHGETNLPSDDEAEGYDAERPLDLWKTKIEPEEESLPEEAIPDRETVPPDAAIGGRELVEQLQQEVKSWPRVERQVFELYYLVGLQLGDITMILHETEAETCAVIDQIQLRLRDFVGHAVRAGSE
jgi:ribosome-associated translation inhibitor RaiA/DNA-directed RNA polymerase specialized sigma24 family protein